jgi:beta-lactamase regulating signal transducer with metallopeptidase domain
MHPIALHFLEIFRGAMPLSASSLAAACRTLCDQIADFALTAVWQGALVTCGLSLCLRLVPRISAAYRFKVWVAAFFVLMSLPLLGLAAKIEGGAVVAGSSQVAGSASEAWLNVDARWSLLIAGLWAATSLFRAVDLAIHAHKLRKLWREVKPVALEGKPGASIMGAIATYGRGEVEVCTTVALDRPSVIGFFKPRILIPDWLLARLTPGELEQIVLHEAEHLRRRDDWTNLLQKLGMVIFPLNPALVWIERRLCREREMACDEGVVRITRAPRAYAACLASLAEHGLERRAEALSLGAWQKRPELAYRVHSILKGKHALGPVGARLLLGTVGCGLLLGSVELARCPLMVAFVPERNAKAAQAVSANATLPVQTADSVNSARLQEQRASEMERVAMSAVRAVPAGLRIPSGGANPKIAVVSDSAGRKTDLKLSQTASYKERTADAPKAVMLKAEMPEPAPAQQWVVLTTWSQVEAANQSAGVKADYDTSAAPNDNATAGDASALPDSQPNPQTKANQITVTRLILRVVPAGAAANFGGSSKSNSVSGQSSTTGQPGTTVIRDGWLVIQL